jgi:hypothetical protein
MPCNNITDTPVPFNPKSPGEINPAHLLRNRIAGSETFVSRATNGLISNSETPTRELPRNSSGTRL